MQLKNFEKKIYELLGVNLFRKYILFTLEKIYKSIGLTDMGYRINNLNINSITNYKKKAKGFAYAHLLAIIGIIPIYLLDFTSLSTLRFTIIINSYCVMTQRYTCLRINEVLEKYKELEKRKQNLSLEKQKQSENTLTKKEEITKEYSETNYYLQQPQELSSETYTRKLKNEVKYENIFRNKGI